MQWCNAVLVAHGLSRKEITPSVWIGFGKCFDRILSAIERGYSTRNVRAAKDNGGSKSMHDQEILQVDRIASEM